MLMTIRRALFMLVVVTLFAATAFAQSEPITYDTFVSNTIDATNPARFFEFSGEAGDFIAAEAIALDNTLDPQISLLSGQSPLAVSGNDPFQPGSGDARVTYVLPQAGTYTILVQAQNGTIGQFVLRLDLLEPPTTEPLQSGIVTTASVTPDLPSRAYTFDSSVENVINVSSPAPGVGFVMEVRAPDGQTVAVQRGPLVTEAQTVVAPGSGTYTLIVGIAQANQSATLDIVLGDGDGEPTTTGAPASQVEADDTTGEETAELPDTSAPADADNPLISGPTPTPNGAGEVVEGSDDTGDTAQFGAQGNAASNAPSNRCTVVPVGNVGVNVRRDPSTDSPVIASIPGNEFRFAEATNGAWIRLQGGGWVSAGVVEQSEACASLLDQVTTVTETDPVTEPTADPGDVNPIGQRN